MHCRSLSFIDVGSKLTVIDMGSIPVVDSFSAVPTEKFQRSDASVLTLETGSYSDLAAYREALVIATGTKAEPDVLDCSDSSCQRGVESQHDAAGDTAGDNPIFKEFQALVDGFSPGNDVYLTHSKAQQMIDAETARERNLEMAFVGHSAPSEFMRLSKPELRAAFNAMGPSMERLLLDYPSLLFSGQINEAEAAKALLLAGAKSDDALTALNSYFRKLDDVAQENPNLVTQYSGSFRDWKQSEKNIVDMKDLLASSPLGKAFVESLKL